MISMKCLSMPSHNLDENLKIENEKMISLNAIMGTNQASVYLSVHRERREKEYVC